MLAIARTIIERRIEKFDPRQFRDRYQEALRELIEAKMKGLPIRPREVVTPAPGIDLMVALKHSLAQETPAAKIATAKKRAKATADRRQVALLLPLAGGRKKKEQATEPATVAAKRGRKAWWLASDDSGLTARAVILLANWPYTIFVITPANRRLMNTPPGAATALWYRRGVEMHSFTPALSSASASPICSRASHLSFD
jgi:hypothetical protein